MSRTRKQHLASIAVFACFLFLAAGSAKVNKLHCGSFNYYNKESGEGDQSYVILKDGQKIVGEDVSWKSGLFSKDVIKINDVEYKIKDTRGYYRNGNYYGTLGNSFAKRIVHGKLNVYYTENSVSVASTNTRTGVTTWRDRQVCTHYVQKGEDGPLDPIATQKDIIKYVGTCPAAVEMIEKKDKDIRKAIRKNPNYLNDIFITYNNGCK